MTAALDTLLTPVAVGRATSGGARLGEHLELMVHEVLDARQQCGVSGFLGVRGLGAAEVDALVRPYVTGQGMRGGLVQVVIGAAPVGDLLRGLEVAAAGAEPASGRRPQQRDLPLVVERVARQIRVLLSGLVVHYPRRRRSAPVAVKFTILVSSLNVAAVRWSGLLFIISADELQGVLNLRLHR